MLIQLYLGTGILVETIVVVDILVGFFSQLSRLCCWCDCWIFEYCFFTLNVLVFRCCVQSFCCRVDELVLRGVLTVVLWLYRCFVEVFWRRLNNFNRGAVRVEGTIYFFFFTSVLWTFAKSNATHTSTSRKYKKTITTHQHLPTQW